MHIIIRSPEEHLSLYVPLWLLSSSFVMKMMGGKNSKEAEAKYPELQKKAWKEIIRVLRRYKRKHHRLVLVEVISPTDGIVRITL
jgi:hypothetical protein